MYRHRYIWNRKKAGLWGGSLLHKREEAEFKSQLEHTKLVLVACAYNPSAREMKTGKFLELIGQ